jgi:RNA polymerase subunit RPABC4/transcription elongation factor Spt4
VVEPDFLVIVTFAAGRGPAPRILAALVVAVLFLPGIVIYRICARRTLEDYQHTLEEEALLQSIEESSLCPGCSRRIKDNWVVCPQCHTKLKKACHKCGKLMELPWNLCPYCGAAAPGMRRENLTLDEALSPVPVSTDGDEEDEGQSVVQVIGEENNLQQE